MNTMPFATTGDPKIEFPTLVFHLGWHGVVHVVGKAYRKPSREPTYTRPLSTAGDDSMRSPVAMDFQRGAHGGLAHPAALKE
jgi:hypothetical protein